MQRVTQWGYVGIGASDVPAWEKFATELMGLEVGGREPDGTIYLRNDDYHHRIAVHPNRPDDLLYAGWEVADAAALAEIKQRLEAAGHSVTDRSAEEARKRYVQALITTTDPNGIQTEVYYGPQRSGPFNSPKGYTFHAGEQGFGHCLLSVDDFEATERFYRDVLGMRHSDYIIAELAPGMKLHAGFLHCNPRHHTLAFAARRPGMPSGKRMGHIMLQTESVDAVGETFDQCQAQGVAASTIGRHTNDHMISFYLTTPSGFQIEYGWGAREIDDNTWQPEVHSAASSWGHKRERLSQPAGSR
jgi:biphenyl-2,3-diol 1,2-dioxygenase